MDKIKIGFYGYGTRALDALMEHPDFQVLHFLTPASRLCDDVFEAEQRYRDYFPMVTVANRRELTEKIAGIHDVSCFLMNASPIILDKAVLEKIDFYNIHPGSLKSNRGHHPHLWSVLLDEKETEICLHKVTEKIDLGLVIGRVPVPLLPDDTSFTLLNRAEDQIPALLTALAAYLRGECEAIDMIREGGYRRQMTYEDYCFNLDKDTLSDMDRKIRARAMHSGGFFDMGDRRVYADKILAGFDGKQTCHGTDTGMTGFELTEGDSTVILTHKGTTAIFSKSKVTDKEGTILWMRGTDIKKDTGPDGGRGRRAGT